MARTASELTKAIRSLCDETNFDITHTQARPILTSKGFSLVQQPPEKSAAYLQWESQAESRPKNVKEMKAWFKYTIKAAGLPASALEAIANEDAMHVAFRNERNYFDVTKSNYKRSVGTADSNPVKSSSENVARKVKAKVVVAASSTSNEIELVQWLVAEGGVSSVQGKIAEMQANVDELQAKLKKATEAVKKLTKSAA
jgi:hypothetical protein